MKDEDLKKQIFAKLLSPEKGIISLNNQMKKDLLYTKEEICGEKSLRKKDTSLDVGKVPDAVLKAAINKLYNLQKKNKFETDFDMYEEIIDLIENETIQTEQLLRYANNFELLKETKSEKKLAEKFAEEQIQNGVIDEEEVDAIKTIVDMMKDKIKNQEDEKFNKEIGKEVKPKDKSSSKSINIAVLKEIIQELGLEDEISVKE